MSLDLFGAETSTNAANYFAAGLKGRFQEERRDDDHRLHDATRTRARRAPTARSASARSPALAALNETLRDDYVADCQKGVDRWNRTLAEVGQSSCGSRTSGFNRRVGDVRRPRTSAPTGGWSTDAEWAASVGRVAADRRPTGRTSSR